MSVRHTRVVPVTHTRVVAVTHRVFDWDKHTLTISPYITLYKCYYELGIQFRVYNVAGAEMNRKRLWSTLSNTANELNGVQVIFQAGNNAALHATLVPLQPPTIACVSLE
jgi:hypothetical protein